MKTLSLTQNKLDSAFKLRTIVQSACSKTGITFPILSPSHSHSFELTCSLADIKTCKSLVNNKEINLIDLESTVLAGLFITLYKDLNLIIYKDSAPIINLMLCSCTKALLAKALIFTLTMKASKTKDLPQLDLDYSTHKEGFNTLESKIEVQLLTWYKAYKEVSESNRLPSRAYAIAEESYVSNRINPVTKSDEYMRFIKAFKLDLATTKAFKVQITPFLLANSKKGLLRFLSDSLVGLNLLITGQSIKDKAYKSLNDLMLETEDLKIIDALDFIASFIKNANHEEHSTAKQLDALERASDSFDKPSKPRTLQQILAARRNKNND